MSQYRKDRVAQEIRRIIGNAILTEIKDPRLAMVSLTGAKISADLSISHIYWLTSSSLPKDEIQKALASATPFLRRLLAQELNLRRTPNLVFHYDDAFERGLQMSNLLTKLRQEGQMGISEENSHNNALNSDGENSYNTEINED